MFVALDHNGPRNVEFEPFEESWVRQGIVPRLLKVADRYPEHTAVSDGSAAYSYASLCAAIDALAERIERECIDAGPIGILLPQSAAFWVAMLACLAAGRPYVALDIHHPASRNAQILGKAALAAIVTLADFDPPGAVIPATLPRIVSNPSGSSHARVPVPCRRIAPGEPAAILYTSGSTGHPKGIANAESALLQRVAQYVNACHLHAGDRFLTLSSPCTIAGTREGLTALLIGATLHVIDAQRSGLADIVQCIRDARISVFNSVPGVLRALIAAQADAADALHSLRIVRIGGEVVFWSDIEQYRRALSPACHIQIGYSSTESTGMQWFVPCDAMPNGALVPVGYVLPGNSASVQDDAGRAVPGEIGELVLRSRFIALGQWQDGHCIDGDIRPDATDPASRVLHTGDLARIDANGLCTIVGRKDRQVKINGMRVEPVEVEAALRSLPEARDAAVIARRSGKVISLAAFVVPRHATPQCVPRIRGALRTLLPAPMRPARIHLLDAIPHLPSGKPDMRALELLDAETDAAPAAAGAGAEASDQLRRAVHRAWRSVLGWRSLCDGASFEDAGGDSLKLLQFVLALEQLLGHRLPLDLFTGDMRPDELIAILHSADQSNRADSVDWRPTIILMPGLDGDEPRLAAFRAVLQDRLRFVLVEYPNWPEMMQNGHGFDFLVEHVMAQIDAAVPDGPLLLAGYSFGGDVAFAVVSRLKQFGRTASFLGILDTDVQRIAEAAARYGKGHATPYRRQAILNGVRDRLSMSLGLLLAKCARDVVGLQRTLQYSRIWRRLLSGRVAFAFDRRIRSVLRAQAQWRWHLATRPAPVDVPTLLFRSGEHDDGTSGDLGWQARCSALSIREVAGDHHTMLDLPHRTALCTAFADAVEAVVAPQDARRLH